MKKLGLIGELITLVAVLAVVFSSCPKEKNGDDGYCVVSGCPLECKSDSDYCYRHECFNFNCTNRGELQLAGGLFCSECASRAID